MFLLLKSRIKINLFVLLFASITSLKATTFSLTSPSTNNVSIQEQSHEKKIVGIHKKLSETKVLFIVPGLLVGGLEKAFVAMYNNFPYEFKKIDVCILERGGDLEPLLKPGIRIVSLETASKKKYDTVIAYGEFLNPKLWVSFRCPNKVQWIHTDMSTCSWHFPLHERKNCTGIDYFVCVSEKASEGFKKVHPDLSSKVVTIYNIIDNDTIKKESTAPINDMIVNDGIVNVVTVCRLSPEKGLSRCVRVHKRLEDEGIHFRWYVVGEGVERQPLTELIKQTGMEHNFILLGKKLNPYPYMQAADVVSLLSFFEGFAVVIAEAKILGKPFLATNFSGSSEQLQNNVTGIVVDNNEEAIYQGLKKLVLDASLRNRISKALEGFVYDNTVSFKKTKAVILKKPI